MKKRILTLFIVMLFVLPTTLSFVTNPGTSNFQNVTEPEKEPVLSYEEEPIKHLAIGGSVDSDLYIDGDYWDTWTDDTSYLSAYPINYTGIHLVFNITERLPLTEINFFLRWQVTISGPVDQPKPVYWTIYNFDTSSYDTVYSEILGSENVTWEDREELITFDANYMNSTNHVRFYAYGNNVYVDEIEVDYAYLTVTKYVGEYRETLHDDVLYYPDLFENDTIITTYAGTGGETELGEYWYTREVNGSLFEGEEAGVYGGVVLGFAVGYPYPDSWNWIRGISYSVYCSSSDGSGDLQFWDSDTDNWGVDVEDTFGGAALEWMNGSVYNPFYFTGSTTYDGSIVIRLLDDSPANVSVDYAQITLHYMTLADSNNYAESFSDVSDWVYEADVGLESDEYGIDTDGDVGRIWLTPNDTGVYEWVQYAYTFDTAISSNAYVEWAQHGSTQSILYITLEDSDSTTWTPMAGGIGDYWYYYKQYISNTLDDVKKIIIKVYEYPSTMDSGISSFSFDYFRISSAEQTGWQHDGSTINGYDNDGDIDKNYTISSDDDILTFGVDHSSGTGSSYSKILPDTTSTDTDIERNHYPFVKARYRMTTYDIGATGFTLSWASDGRRTQLFSDSDYVNNTWITSMLNVYVGTSASSSNYGLYVYCSGTEGSYLLDVDYVKLYSIANYTVTQSSTTSDDFIYVDSGILYSDMDDGEFILEYESTLNYTGSYTWTKYSTSGESYLSFLHNGWTDYSNETTGDLYSGSTTGLRIKFNASANIQTIDFSVRQAKWVLIGTAIIAFELPEWYIIATARAIFYLPIGDLTISFLLMIMGLAMIPFSTLFLVKGGREEMDRDKAYFFLLMFLFGWAFFLGGLM